MSQNTYFYYKTIAGQLKVLLTDTGISEATFIENQNKISSDIFDLTKLNLNGTEFQKKVWLATLQVPSGKTASYQDIAKEIGHANAHRAVANALASNKIAYFVPCHRIIRKDGKLGGYKWGIEKKLSLLKAENVI